MKILFLTTQVPYPPSTSATIRVFNLIKGIALEHELTLCTFITGQEERNQLKYLIPFCKNVVPLSTKKFSLFGSLNLFLKNIFSKKPLLIQKTWSSQIYREIKTELKRHEFDLIHCDNTEMAQYVLKISNIPKILSIDKSGSRRYKRIAFTTRRALRRRFLIWQWHKIEQYERFVEQHFDILLVSSKVERNELTRVSPNAWIEELPNGVDSSFYAVPQRDSDENQNILLPISMQNTSDEDALVHFFTEIWPLVKNKRQHVKLFVVGREAANRLKSLERDPDIFVNGQIDDLRPFVAKSSIVVAPHRRNGATPTGLLEALSMGKTVVATSVSCKGLDVTPGKEVVIADDPAQFAQNVIYLLKNPELSSHLGLRGRSLIEQKYDWQIISNRLKAIYHKASTL